MCQKIWCHQGADCLWRRFGCAKRTVASGRAGLAGSSNTLCRIGRRSQPNPTDPKVYEGIDICREEAVDMLLAVGGGSVIDTAKAIAAGVPYQGDFWDFFAGKSIVKKALKVGVVLTIPAAGSEGSGNSVITRLDGLQKLSLRTPPMPCVLYLQ